MCRDRVLRTVGAINVASFDLIAVQSEVCDGSFAELHGVVAGCSDAGARRSCRIASTEECLQAFRRCCRRSCRGRATVGTWTGRGRCLKPLWRGIREYAPAWTGLGITHLQYAQHGLGGQMHVLGARRAFDKALTLDSSSVEAVFYRIYVLLSRGEKESARHGIEHLLQTAGNDWNAHLVAGT